MEITLFNKILLGLTAVTHLVLGTVVYRKSPYSLLNRLVMGYTLLLGLWALVVLMILFENTYEPLLMWVRIAHALTAFGPWFVVALVYCFREERYPTRLILVLLGFSCILSVLSLTPLIISGIDVPLEQKDPLYGPLFILYTLFFVGTMGYGIFLLFRQTRKVRGIARYQIRYFAGGLLLSFVLAAMVNLFLPLFGFKALDMRSYGPVFTLIMAISITYSIVKYRLMDIYMAMRKALVYALTVVVMGGAFYLPLRFLTTRSSFADSPSLLLIVFLAMVIAIFFQTAREFIRTALVERYMHRGKYNYYGTLKEVSRAVVSILNLEKLLNYLVNRVVDTAQIQQGVFYLRKNQEGPFESMAIRTLPSTRAPDSPGHLEADNPLLVYLKNHDDVLLRSDLRGNLTSLELEVAKMLSELKAEAAVPVKMEGELNGVFVLGPKRSGEPYSTEDVNLLLALSSQLAVALKNAQFHREVTGMKHYLENVLENMGNGLLTTDASGKIITFNVAAERITGLSSPDVMGRQVEDVLSQELSFFLKQTLLRGRGLCEVELEVPTEDGSWRYLSCSTAMVELPDNEHGAILVMSDMTQQKELEKEKSRAERLASLGELAAGMAHEIKNPLVSIKTFAELLPERFEEHDFRHSFSRIVGQEIDRINSLVTKLLGFAKDSEQFLENMDAVDVLEEILLLLSPQLDSYGIRLEKQLDPWLPPVWADRNQLKQALYNICQNAVEAMAGGGGELKVQASWRPYKVRHWKKGNNQDSDELPTHSRGNIKIAIQDTGEGISTDKQEKIFDPFFTTKSYGVGIGLSISHRIVKDYGGEFKMYSTEGKGTLFEVMLPASRENQPARREDPEEPVEDLDLSGDLEPVKKGKHNRTGRKNY